ncbi:hypothetical protein WISP_69117 [Willisornis vidua]|uniref:Uncharacterized protein n=1 Tax=Willisornis vidua TaxID=1566151 RepID=A0ABQ9D9A3_9PASS|nr:hypothetical protein WISP_69117 [Willisornis vidua]
MELFLGMNEPPNESLQVRIKDRTGKLMRIGVLLNLLFINEETLIGDVKAKGSCGSFGFSFRRGGGFDSVLGIWHFASSTQDSSFDCRDHEMATFRTLRTGRRVKSKNMTQNFSRDVFDLFDNLLGRVPKVIFEWSWDSKEVPADWNLANIVLVFKKGKENPGNYRLVNLTSVPDTEIPKVLMEKIILGSVGKHLKVNAVIGHSQHSFMK